MPIIPAQDLRRMRELIQDAQRIVLQYEQDVVGQDPNIILEETKHFIDTKYRLQSILWHLELIQ